MQTIFIPIVREVEAPKCPSCHSPEETKTVCVHCNHEYEEEESGGFWSTGWSVVVIVIAAIFVGLFMWWAMQVNSDYRPYKGSFVDFLGEVVTCIWGTLKKIV